MNVFDFVNDISFDKQYLFNEVTEKEYVPFVINKALMQHMDTVLLASEMNKMSSLTKQMQHDYLFNTVDSKKRFGKWAKFDDSIEMAVKNIMSKYGCNREIAEGYYHLLSDDQKSEINKEKVKGGKK